MISVQVLVDKLNSFKTSGDIADFLFSQNITGTRGCSTKCIITNWIIRESEEYNISTTLCSVLVWGDKTFTMRENYHLDPIACNFIVDFDYGLYPELIS